MEKIRSGQVLLPYILKKSANKKYFVFCGVEHSTDPNHQQFNKIISAFEEFNQHQHLKAVVLVEANPKPAMKNVKEAILNRGEVGLAEYLANSKKFPAIRPEPSLNDEVDQLLKGFTIEQIQTLYFCRIICQWYRLSFQPDFEEHIHNFIRRYHLSGIWSQKTTVSDLIQIFEQVLGRKFDLRTRLKSLLISCLLIL
jgi:hypothetical protein